MANADWRDVALEQLELVGSLARADLLPAISAPPVLDRAIDSASTLTIPCTDARLKLLQSKALKARSWVTVDGLRYELVQLRKTGSGVSLVFEDSVSCALRRRKGALTKKAGTRRRDFLAQLAREAHVDVDLDPGKTLGRVRNALVREAGEDSWDASGRVAADVGWRRFSDGRRLVCGADAWLITRGPRPVLVEHQGAVDGIDWDWDLGKPVASYTVTAAIDRSWVPGNGFVIDGQGPADGPVLLVSMSRPLTSRLGTLNLERRQPQLPEPKAENVEGDEGDLDGLPDTGADDPGGVATGKAKAALSAVFALKGKPYVYGGGHPNPLSGGYDCSGVVGYYARAGGSSALSSDARGQLAACQRAGTTVSVATALRTRGALLFNIGGGSGASGNHVAISLGNGMTFEGKGRAYGVGVFGKASGRGWNHGATVPGF